jgi:hypothetical protein
MDHSYEEIRSAAIQYLSQLRDGSQYVNFKNGIGQILKTKEQGTSANPSRSRHMFVEDEGLSRRDADLFLEIFWGLFREGIITLGYNDHNPEFPWFRVSEFGKKVLSNQDPYFFRDVSTYESLVRARVRDIDETTLLYLKEAVQAFQSGCILSSSVMIGVSAEHSFLLLLDTISASAHATLFKKATDERSILRKLNAFKKIIDGNMNLLSSRTKEDLDTQFMSVITMIRNFRNESGHPSGKIISREQCYILLQVFIPCCEKIYQLMEDLQ